ncbi:2-oxoglutarate dehydrogenase E1 component [Buchnera aphidicola (Takecallis arundicolens)]|uniref:2-oxoglutarate dehydrogenase E1 component n=1 Tax=Buchnera aphidicola TaxID=9 RepID=UPI003464B34D
MKKNYSLHDKFCNLSNSNQIYIEKIYQFFIKNSNCVSSDWKEFFQSDDNYNQYICHTDQKKHINNVDDDHNSIYIAEFIKFVRTYGHQYANLNPLKKSISKNALRKKLLNDFYLDQNIKNNINNNMQKNPYFEEKYSIFTNIYCTSIGIEYMHISNIEERMWIQEYVEKKFLKFFLSQNEKKNLLSLLIKSEIFEKYLHTRFPGSKRFSLEGCEVLIPLLKKIICYTNKKLTSKIIIGMAHRGRLNVLVNILKKKINTLCDEFTSNYIIKSGTGDAKYHSGMKTTKKTKNKNIIIDLKPNPSHLEIINPVVMGSSRAYLDSFENKNSDHVLPINIHGDAAIIGQGVIQELLNISQTRNYTVGGILHIVINNQIGFTTSSLKDIRSSQYCTDIAKMIQTPIFHVNTDFPESVIFITQLALDFKYKFKKDVFIDLVCYRRRGHNEADEPSVTQPIMYQKIQQHPTVCEIYNTFLLSKKNIPLNYLNDERIKQRKKIHELSELPIVHQDTKCIKKKNKNIVPNIDLKILFEKINYIPKTFKIHERVLKIYQARQNMLHINKAFDWGAAENLAYANILSHGISCRLSGEDVSRGTFFHRHSVLYDQNNGLSYVPLYNLQNNKTKYYICNSALSEEAVLAFEYGYSVDAENTINIWEAQFGDFSNGAQIVIDQFISSGEQKWGIKSKLVLLLPHGYEGQGPEHSSSRIERFLQLSAQNNMKICIPSTAAQMYHILMYQALCNIKTPLIIFTPKSLLRNNMTYSTFSDIQCGTFQNIIHEINIINCNNITKIIFCSGKIYYELFSTRQQYNIKNISLIRIEQLYPFPKNEIIKILNYYHNIQEITWCQEEPKNQGMWYYMYNKLKENISSNITLKYVGRNASAAPAVGCLSIHNKQQKKIIFDALNIL